MLYSVNERIKYDDPIETIGCVTDRPGSWLVRQYGYEDVDHLCTAIPKGAAVLDAGSGLSDLGQAVTTRRPDIAWTNFDARYGNMAIPRDERENILRAQRNAPPNLTYVGGNVLEIPAQIKVQRFNKIFSYYMFPYLIDYFGETTAARGVANILELLAPDGSFSTGPNRYEDIGWTETPSMINPMKDLAAETITRYTETWDDYERRRQ